MDKLERPTAMEVEDKQKGTRKTQKATEKVRVPPRPSPSPKDPVWRGSGSSQQKPALRQTSQVNTDGCVYSTVRISEPRAMLSRRGDTLKIFPPRTCDLTHWENERCYLCPP